VIRSMTGFGEASTHENGVHYFLEIRSINGKYFKATIKLPEEFQGLEPELEAELRRRLNRGTITLVAKCSDTSASAAYRINHEALAKYVDQLRLTPQARDGSLSIDIAPLLALPGVLQPPADEEQRLEHARAVYMKLLDTASKELLRMREREGAMLVADLLAQHDLIADRLSRIAERSPSVVEEYQKRLHARVEAMLQDAKVRVDPVDLIREVAVFAEKSDIAEEVTRLSGHMQQFKALLSKQDRNAVGRTLDFLTQEMLREANTIASKSGDAAISRDIVEIKGAIDRIKEQVQNVE